MIHVRVREQNRAQVCGLRRAQAARAGAGIEQNVAVHQHRCGIDAVADAAARAQNFKFHFSSNTVIPSHCAGGFAER